MDRYIYIRSDDSNHLFTENTVDKFSVQLDYPLRLQGSWKVALKEFHASEESKSRIGTMNALYVYSDICGESIVKCAERPLLRRMKKNGKSRWDYIFDSPYYLPLRKRDLKQFRFYIQQEDGSPASLLKGPIHITLHLKPALFI